MDGALKLEEGHQFAQGQRVSETGYDIEHEGQEAEDFLEPIYKLKDRSAERQDKSVGDES